MLNNRDLNIDQNNSVYDSCHNRVALILCLFCGRFASLCSCFCICVPWFCVSLLFYVSVVVLHLFVVVSCLSVVILHLIVVIWKPLQTEALCQVGPFSNPSKPNHHLLIMCIDMKYQKVCHLVTVVTPAKPYLNCTWEVLIFYLNTPTQPETVIFCALCISRVIYQLVTLYSRYMSRASKSNPARTARMMIHTGTENWLSGLFHITAITTWTTGNHSDQTGIRRVVPPFTDTDT